MQNFSGDSHQKAPPPAALGLGESVEIITVQGEFDCETSTWSNREFECASAKKHCEGM